MNIYEIDPRHFFHILFAMLRDDSAHRRPDYTGEVMGWVAMNLNTLERVLSNEQFRVLTTIDKHWHRHRVVPNRENIVPLIRQKHQPEAAIDLLAVYDEYAGDLKEVNVKELDVHLDHCIADWEKHRCTKYLAAAYQMAVSGMEIGQGGKKQFLSGPRDTIAFLRHRFGEGILLDRTVPEGGAIGEMAASLRDDYESYEERRRTNQLFIPSGLQVIDGAFGGLRRKELVGILGYTAQRKTGLARTIAYHAAKKKMRVLHIPIETDVEEELTAYAAMFAMDCRGRLPGVGGITKTRIERALLNDEEKKLFLNDIIPGMAKEPGEYLTIRYPGNGRSWADIQAIIDHECFKHPVDLVILDYLTLLSTPGNRDERVDKNSIIQRAKQYAMTANNGRGLCLLTPVQGSRHGYEEATACDGMWSSSGVYMYSELEKSIDTLLYVYLNDEMNARNMIKVGSCKSRRNLNIPATVCNIDQGCGAIVDALPQPKAGAHRATHFRKGAF